MQYRTLGRTGVQVSAFSFGAMMLGRIGNTDPAECKRIIDIALDAGINLIDTADTYSGGESEEIVGRAIRDRRDDVLLATKFHHPMGPGPNDGGNSRRWIMRACEDSLRRLGVDHIDLYQAHRPDPRCSIEETLGALTDLVTAGKVRYIGTSCFQPSQIVEAQWASERWRLQRFASEQSSYSLLARGIELDVLPTCARHGIGVIVWSPLAGGWLTGAWRSGAGTPASTRAGRLPQRYDLSLPHNQRKLAATDALASLADELGMSLVCLALAWAAANPLVTSVIIGPRTVQHLTDQLAAVDVSLPPEVMARIDEIVAPSMNFSLADVGYAPPNTPVAAAAATR